MFISRQRRATMGTSDFFDFIDKGRVCEVWFHQT